MMILLIFFDSLGKDMQNYGYEFIEFAKKFSSKFQRSTVRTQPHNTSLCGQYCLYFAYKRCNGEQMEDILKSMVSPEHVLSFANSKFQFCNNSKCILFQTCNKC